MIAQDRGDDPSRRSTVVTSGDSTDGILVGTCSHPASAGGRRIFLDCGAAAEEISHVLDYPYWKNTALGSCLRLQQSGTLRMVNKGGTQSWSTATEWESLGDSQQ